MNIIAAQNPHLQQNLHPHNFTDSTAPERLLSEPASFSIFQSCLVFVSTPRTIPRPNRPSQCMEVFRGSFIPGYNSSLVNGELISDVLSLQSSSSRTCHCQVCVYLLQQSSEAKVFPVPRRSDVRPSLWTWWGKPQWVAIDYLKPAHSDPEEPVELTPPHEEGRPCFCLWPSHRPHC